MDRTKTGILVRFVPYLLGLLGAASCSEHERLPNYQSNAGPSAGASGHAVACATPKQGCACDEPGAAAPCGEVRTTVDGYASCAEAVRLCGSDGTWGACETTGSTPLNAKAPSRKSMALGASADCTATNPCDPLCREIVDTGTGLTELPEHLCSTALGLAACDQCGYERPTTLLTYSQWPTDWQVQPESCTTSPDSCTLDTHCVGGKCIGWSAPCKVADAACAVDITIGSPCVGTLAPSSSYHIPVCNRGTTRLDIGTIRIGIDTRPEAVTAEPYSLDGFPNAGYLTYGMWTHPERYIDPGKCVDINPSNSELVGSIPDHTTVALVMNYAGEIPECNDLNDTAVLVSTAEPSGGSVCSNCDGFSCNQSDPNTTLRGTVYDPAGRTVLPNVTVYVPNSEVAQLINAPEATCDTCESLLSGSPIAITRTDAVGNFTLPNVPSGVAFPLVIQTGRWRRQVTVSSVAAGATRWVNSCVAGTNTTGNSSADCDLATTQPTAIPELQRLRLPRSQRRCSASVCGGEGDIPKMALIMGDADPMQCLLRRIGVVEGEMTTSQGSGRIHLFNHNGMQIAGGQTAYGAGGLLGDAARLQSYAALLAPCDYAHASAYGAAYSGSLYRSGPSYNSPPDPTASDAERANVKAYVDSGGRLFASHWMSMDFVHLNYSPPDRAHFVTPGAVPLLSPSDPASNAGLSTRIASIATAGWSWKYQSMASYNPSAPAVHLFGRNIEAVGNTSEPLPPGFSPIYPHFDYAIDQSPGNQLGVDLATWAAAVGASPAGKPGYLRFHSWSPLVREVRTGLGVSRLAYGNTRVESSYYYTGTKPARVPSPQTPCVSTGGTTTPDGCRNPSSSYWGDENVALFQFDTPLRSADKCGRVAVAQSHVTRHACKMPSMAPTDCAAAGANDDCSCVQLPSAAEWTRGCGDSAGNLAALQPEELAFEYMLFSTTQCLGSVTAPPVGALLPNAKIKRLFQAECARGEQPVWQLFSLQATIPSGASIGVAARTADTEADVTTANWTTLPDFVTSTTGWTSSPHTLDYYFRNGLVPPDVSRTWLEVSMELRPAGNVSPVLSQWRAIYNCVAIE